MGERQLVYEGYLVKSPPLKKIDRKWRKRYFRLWSDKNLEYYKNEIEPNPLREAIDLSLCVEVISTGNSYQKHFRHDYKWALCIKMPQRNYHLLAKSFADQQNWKDKILEVCSTTSNLPVYIENDYLSAVESSSNSSVSSRVTDRSGSESSSRYVTSCIPISREALLENEINRASEGIPSTQYDELPPPRPALPVEVLSPVDIDISFLSKYPNETEAVYDVPPNAKKSFRKKQVSTKSSASSVTSELGYIQMDPSIDEFDGQDYNDEEYIRMQGVTPPDDLISKGIVKEFKPFGSTLNRIQQSQSMPATSSTPNTRYVMERFGNVIEDDVIFDEIPSIFGKRYRDTVLEPEPPLVDRNIKPLPAVDRTKKPKINSVDSKLHLKSSTPNVTGYMNVTSLSRQPSTDDYVMHNVTHPQTLTNPPVEGSNVTTGNGMPYAKHERTTHEISDEVLRSITYDNQRKVDSEKKKFSNDLPSELKNNVEHEELPASTCKYKNGNGAGETHPNMVIPKEDFPCLNIDNNNEEKSYYDLPNRKLRGSKGKRESYYDTLVADETYSNDSLGRDVHYNMLPAYGVNNLSGELQPGIYDNLLPTNDNIIVSRNLDSDVYCNIAAVSNGREDDRHEEAYLNMQPTNQLTTHIETLNIEDNEYLPYENACDINQNWAEPNEVLEYIECVSPKRNVQKSQTWHVLGKKGVTTDISYITVDPVKSAAAVGLRN